MPRMAKPERLETDWAIHTGLPSGKVGDESVVATTNVPAGTETELAGSFRGNAITPATLTANTQYIIAGPGGGGDRIREGDDTVRDSQIVIV